MKIAEMLQKAQYARITVGYRWLTADSSGWIVLERKPRSKNTKILLRTESEDEAVRELLKGDEAYSDLIKL